jgi:hypothetical protein
VITQQEEIMNKKLPLILVVLDGGIISCSLTKKIHHS